MQVLDFPRSFVTWRIDDAFAAHNAPDWIEFIVRRPTPIVDGVENTVYRIPQDAPATARRVDLEGGNC